MSVKELQKLVAGGGFRPFVITTTTGEHFEVRHPEVILVGKYTAAVLDKEGYMHWLDPLHIVSVRELTKRQAG